MFGEAPPSAFVGAHCVGLRLGQCMAAVPFVLGCNLMDPGKPGPQPHRYVSGGGCPEAQLDTKLKPLSQQHMGLSTKHDALFHGMSPAPLWWLQQDKHEVGIHHESYLWSVLVMSMH